MYRLFLLLLCCCGALSAAAKPPDLRNWVPLAPPGLPEIVLRALAKGESLTVYAIQPNLSPSEKRTVAGYPVVKEVILRDPAQRAKLAAAIKKETSDTGAQGEKRFLPHHALRVRHGANTYELVLDYPSRWCRVYKAGKRIAMRPLPKYAKSLELLTAAGISTGASK